MIYTIIAFLAVLGTKFATQIRLKGLKVKLDSMQPQLDEVRLKLREAEGEYDELKLKTGDSEVRLTHLRAAVNSLENVMQQPAAENDSHADERARVSAEVQTVEAQA